MQKHEYDIIVNKNTIRCWLIIAIVLTTAYFIEIIKGLRTIEYVIIFVTVMILPLIITVSTYCFDESSRFIKMEFAIGYCTFYTFVVFTTQSPAAFVYILPMVSIIMSYCDRALIFSVFGYALFINITDIFVMCMNQTYLTITTLNESVTFWEIQIACLVLTGIFLFLSTELLRKRNIVIENIVNDVYMDALTGLKNVRFINKNASSVLSFDNNEYLALAFIDVDNFKQFNTNYGHSFGDEVLQSLSRILLENIQKYDKTYAVRNGGDEFLIISRTLNDDFFINLIQKICMDIENMELNPDCFDGVHITVSVGISSKHLDKFDCDSFKSLYDKADDRNQKAKDSGKNKIIYED